MYAAYASPFPQIDGDLLKIFLRQKQTRSGGMSGFIDDLAGDLWDGVSGLNDAIGHAMDAIVHTVKAIGETIALVVRASIGDVSWSEVLASAGKIFQGIGTVFAVLNPIRLSTDWLKESAVLGHSFNELDKFTGGGLTNITNISDLPWRAMRGDPISKAELIHDALFAIQVAAVVATGPVALGLMVGNMFGREVCQHQTKNQEVCVAAFQIVGAAAGSWAGAYYDVNWGTTYWNQQDVVAEDGSGFVPGEAGYAAAGESSAASSSTSFLAQVSASGSQYLTSKGIDQITQQAIAVCQKQGWAGKQECQILAGIAGDYIKIGSDMPWEDFLATEVAKIGAEQLLLQWFPPDSKEYAAIHRKWTIKYVDVPVESEASMNPWTILVLAGGAAALLLGVGS